MKDFLIRYHKFSATIGYRIYKAESEEKAIQKFRRYSSATILAVQELTEENE